MSTGFVYLVAEKKRPSIVKIGWAKDPEARLKNLNVGNSKHLIIKTAIAGVRALEKGLHYRFSDKHIRGEWFNDSDGEISAILQNPAELAIIQTLKPQRIKANNTIEEENWSEKIIEIESTGWSLTRISRELEMSVSMLCDLKKGRNKAPCGFKAKALWQLHKRCCGRRKPA